MEVTSDHARPQSQHPNIRTTQFIAQRVCEALLTSLVGVVDGFTRERRRLERSSRRDIEDRAVRRSGFHTTIEDRMCGVHVAGDVSGVHGLDGGDGEIVEGSWSIERKASLEWILVLGSFLHVKAKYVTHIVDEYVNPPELLDCGSNCSIDGIVVANIGYSVDDLTTSIGSLQLLLQCRQFDLAAVSDRAEVNIGSL